jgi:iron complex transport system substrate-binding protein
MAVHSLAARPACEDTVGSSDSTRLSGAAPVLFAAGHWVPEMIALAGGTDCFAEPGAHSRRLTWD